MGFRRRQGNIRFNSRIIQTPTGLIDYVVAHELVHLAHPDHTRDFWSTLGRAMPRSTPGSAVTAWAPGGVVT
jgi:predicted metal-dependent hydrolase